jgi:aspartate 1-decarboxylase
MQRFMLKSKIHGAVITDKQLQYAGSITLDENLLKAANMLPGEQVQVLNLNNGMRFLTYTIVAPAGSGTVMLNGPAARLGEVGDTVLVLSYGIYDDSEAGQLEPIIVRVGERNQPMKQD